MSVWSSTTGKTTYAERLRLASQSSGRSSSGRPSKGNTSSQPAVKGHQNTTSPLKNVPASPTHPSEASSPLPKSALRQSTSPIATTLGPQAVPATNVWEARKKQMATKDAGKQNEGFILPPGTSTLTAGQTHLVGSSSGTQTSPRHDRSMSASSTKSTPKGDSARSLSVNSTVRDKPWMISATSQPAKEASQPITVDARANAEHVVSKEAIGASDSRSSSTQREAKLNPTLSESAIEDSKTAGIDPDGDNAWLARIHLLNGGQNMPNYSEGGPNGISDNAVESSLNNLSNEAETQKADRAVAAAWVAGKTVWQKSQQQIQQASTIASATSAAPQHEALASPARPSVSIAGSNKLPNPVVQPVEKQTRDGDQATSSRQHLKSKRKDPQAPIPSFEDVNKWPSPSDAIKKATSDSKPKPSTSGLPHAERSRDEKSIYETLDELHLQATPGAAPHAASSNLNNGRGKKGKQWISVVPEIIHTSSQPKQTMRAGDAKAGRGNKQGKKDKNTKHAARSQKKEQGAASAADGSEPVSPKVNASHHTRLNSQHKDMAGRLQSSPSSGTTQTAGDNSAAQTRDGNLNKQIIYPKSNLSSHTLSNPSTSPRVNDALSPPATVPYANVPPFARPSELSPIFYPHSPHDLSGAGWVPYAQYMQTSPQILERTVQPLPSGPPGQLLSQVEFYFSQRNLEGDFFLRQKMDAGGWVDLSIVAGFKRVQNITRDFELVEQTLLHSAVLDVDVENKKVRRRFGWETFLLPETGSLQQSLEATPTASRGSTGLVSPPSSFSRSSTTGEHDDADETKQQDHGMDDDDQILGVVASAGLGGTLDHPSSHS